GDGNGGSKKGLIFGLIAGVVVLALIATAVVVLRGGDDGIQAAGEVFLEPASSPGPDPFTASVAAAVPAPVRLARPPAPSPSPAGTPAATPVRSINATAPGLY